MAGNLGVATLRNFLPARGYEKMLVGGLSNSGWAVSYDLCGIILRQSLLCNGGRFNMLSCIFIKNPAFSCS